MSARHSPISLAMGVKMSSSQTWNGLPVPLQAAACVFVLLVLICSAAFCATDANRLTYLDELNPYYVSRTFPRLVTPQWVGEEGVDAVVVFAIDDMRDPQKYEQFLRPILNCLEQ